MAWVSSQMEKTRFSHTTTLNVSKLSLKFWWKLVTETHLHTLRVSRCPHMSGSIQFKKSFFFLLSRFSNTGLPHMSSRLSPTGSCTRQRNCRPTLSRLTTRTWTRMRSVMTIFLTNAFPISALHTGRILSRTFKSVYHSLVILRPM